MPTEKPSIFDFMQGNGSGTSELVITYGCSMAIMRQCFGTKSLAKKFSNSVEDVAPEPDLTPRAAFVQWAGGAAAPGPGQSATTRDGTAQKQKLQLKNIIFLCIYPPVVKSTFS